MRVYLTPLLVAAVFAAGCAPTSDEVASDEVTEMPTSPDTVEREPAPDQSTSSDEPTGHGTSDDVAAPDEGGQATAEDVTVSIGDFFFAPDGLIIQAGDKVTWTHDGDITHNVTARDDSFASDNLASGETFTHTFAEVGSFEYRCTLHGQMVATINVS